MSYCRHWGCSPGGIFSWVGKTAGHTAVYNIVWWMPHWGLSLHPKSEGKNTTQTRKKLTPWLGLRMSPLFHLLGWSLVPDLQATWPRIRHSPGNCKTHHPDWRSSAKFKEDKLKEIYTQAHHTQTSEKWRKEKILKAARGKWTGNYNLYVWGVPTRNHRHRKEMEDYLLNAERKKYAKVYFWSLFDSIGLYACGYLRLLSQITTHNVFTNTVVLSLQPL